MVVNKAISQKVTVDLSTSCSVAEPPAIKVIELITSAYFFIESFARTIFVRNFSNYKNLL